MSSLLEQCSVPQCTQYTQCVQCSAQYTQCIMCSAQYTQCVQCSVQYVLMYSAVLSSHIDLIISEITNLSFNYLLTWLNLFRG